MHVRPLFQLALLLALLLSGASECRAAIIKGTVEAVNAAQRTITLKFSSKGTIQTFDVRASASITIEKQKAGLDEVVVGQTVTVTTNKSDEITKIVADLAAGGAGSAGKTSGPGGFGVQNTDWPQFRGPNRDNISQETGLLASWPEDGPSLVWKQSNLGLGYSSVAVADGKLYTMGNRGEDEFLLALDAATGEHLWAQRTGSAYHDGMGDGPRGTPTVDGKHVYALGANGDLVCAKSDSGDVVWRMNILQEFDGRNIQWGISESVLIDGDVLVCTPGGKEATLVGLNKQTGKLKWRSKISGSPPAAYSSAIAVNVGNVYQYVNFVHTAVVGVNARDGRPLWSNKKSANGTANCSTPLFANDAIFSASGYGTGGALVKLEANKDNIKPTFVYHTNKMKNHHGGMVALSGYIYGFDEDVLTCLDWEQGKVQWQDRSVGKGSLTVADGHLYLRSENGPLALARVFPGRYEESGRFNQPDRSGKPSWAYPIVANGKLFLRDMDTLLAYTGKAEAVR